MRNKYIIILVLILMNQNYAQWTQLNAPFGKNITGLFVSNNSIFVSTDSNGVYYSGDGGQNWTQRNNGITHLRLLALTKNNNTLAVGTFGGGVFISTNDGISWSASTSGMSLPYIYSLLFTYPNNYILAGSGGYGAYISSDGGSNWNICLGTNYIVNDFHRTINGYYLCAAGPKLYKSTDEGLNWTYMVTANTTLKSILTTSNGQGGMNIFIGSLDGMFLSTNEGANWSVINNGIQYKDISSLASFGSYVFAASYGGGVYLTTNNGQSWSGVNTGLTDLKIKRVFIDGQFIYAASENGTVFKRDLSQIVTSVEADNDIVSDFNLKQNYPNPFNPSTKISWQTPIGSRQILEVYDILGNKVATLVDEYREAGNYEVEFNAKGLSSGVYLYKLQSGEFMQVKKMIISK